MSERSPLYDVQFLLNNALMQSPSTISKTEKAINYIRHYSILSRANCGNVEDGTHHMTIVLTNNNLSETSQWKVRVNNKLGSLNSLVLSSRSDSDMRSIDQLWAKMMRMTKPDELPDLIIMCTHEKRTGDLVDILRTLKKKHYDFRSIGIQRITITIMFDEADKNMRLIAAFLKVILPLFTVEELRQDTVVRDIHFITATPLDDFWNGLKHSGISKLKNINHAIQTMDENSVLHSNYGDLMKQYRWLSDHAHDFSIESLTEDPVAYATDVMQSWKCNPSRKIVFAPAGLTQASHYKMRDLFLTNKFHVYVDNGDKKKAKGFYDLNGNFDPLEKFRERHSITGEPYETFKKWNELHPNDSLAITGWLTIIRGITFNTTGFGFTNMILSAGHMNNIADLLQVAGRADGDILYVNKFTLHFPTILWKRLNDRITIMKALHEKNPSEFKEQDFRPKTAREKSEPAWTVPYVFKVSAEEFNSIKKIKQEYDIETIYPLVKNAEVLNEIKRLRANRGQFKIHKPSYKDKDGNCPTTTYEMLVNRFVDSSVKGEKIGININKKDKNRDGYRIHLDEINNNIIVNFYYGSRIDGDNDNDEEEDEVTVPTTQN